MTVAELKRQLDKLPPDDEAKVWVRVYTRHHSVADVTPFEVNHAGIWISLPKDMHVVKRKAPAPSGQTEGCPK